MRLQPLTQKYPLHATFQAGYGIRRCALVAAEICCGYVSFDKSETQQKTQRGIARPVWFLAKRCGAAANLKEGSLPRCLEGVGRGWY